MKILLVEDNIDAGPAIAEMLTKVLEHEVLFASNRNQGYRMIQDSVLWESPIDVVITNYGLHTDRDGVRFLEFVHMYTKEMGRPPVGKIMTSRVSREDADILRQIGAYTLPKVFLHTELEKALEIVTKEPALS